MRFVLKHWIIFLEVLLIAAVVSVAVDTVTEHSLEDNNQPVIVQGVKSALYTNTEYGFSLWYPRNAAIEQSFSSGYLPETAAPVAAVVLPSDMMKGTNLSEAGVFIGVNPAPVAVGNCLVTVQGETASSTVQINGTTFSEFHSLGVGAGNYYDLTTWRTIKHGSCYEIVALLHSGNIHNYPDGAVKEFDQAAFSATLRSIVDSFTFTSQTGSGIIGVVTISPTCPVEKMPPDPNCAPKPYKTDVVISRAGDPAPLATEKSDADGAFKADLAAGTYLVTPASGTPLPRCTSKEFTVTADQFTYATLSCDSGIR
ncbi:hypothetical protein KGO95_00965 [Patescibacteria group bacterium]|nr:hypothetical protein [Patescibacteria group bacterium]